MSEAYDSSIRCVRAARDNILRGISAMTQAGTDTDKIVGPIDQLNKEWEGLTDVLRRQIEERDSVIIYLMDELAQRKHR